MNTILVHPTHPDAIGMKHPDGPPLSKDGSLWPEFHSFTGRRLTDGSIIRETDEGAAEAKAKLAEMLGAVEKAKAPKAEKAIDTYVVEPEPKLF